MFNHEDFYNILEALKEHLKLGLAVGDNSGVTIPGGTGKSLEFTWNGTKLGIRVEGDKNYKFVDLKGASGESPHIDPATNHWMVGTIDTGVDASGSRGADGITPTLKIGTITTLPSGSKATATVTGTSENPILNFGIPKGDAGNAAINTDEKVKMSASSQAKYLSDLIDNATIVVNPASGVIKAVGIQGLQTTVTTLNFIKNLDKDIMSYLSAITNPMGFKGVVPDDAALSKVTGAMAGDTYIVKSSSSNGNKTMTFIYNGTDFEPIAETTINVRNFITDPLNLATEVTGVLGEGNIANNIARAANVLDKATYAGSVAGAVKQADTLTGMTKSIGDIESAVDVSHSHGNKDALENVLDSGDGELTLFDDGVYRKIFTVGNNAPSVKGIFWVDNSTPTEPVLKYWDGTNWKVVSSAGNGTTVTVDATMNDTSANPVQNKVIKKYIDESIPEISMNDNNAISEDVDGHWFVEDKTGQIKTLETVTASMNRAKKFVNTDLEYGWMKLRVSWTNVVNAIVPFAVKSGILEATEGKIKLHAGKTYQGTIHLAFQDAVDGGSNTTFEIRDFTNNVYITDINPHRPNYRYEWPYSCSFQYTAPNDCEIGLKCTWIGTPGKKLDSAKTNFVLMEINHTVEIDPVDYVNTEKGMEDTPVGSIIPLMSNNAPKHYLICDGTVYDIADYVYLAQHIKDEFGTYNYFGGDGVTTFAVPDLRGEFLRGSGTGDRDTGTGSVVGAHQDGTSVVNYNTQYNGIICAPTITTNKTTTSGNDFHNANIDKITETSNYKWDIAGTTGQSSPRRTAMFTTRPTNTAVLWCIKAEPTYFMNIEGRDDYGPDEHLVGYWYDGKPLYQRTIYIEHLPDNTEQGYEHHITDIDFIFYHAGLLHRTTNGNTIPLNFPSTGTAGNSSQTTVYVNKTHLYIQTMMNRSDCIAYATLRYTKTTDMPRRV